MDRMTDDFMVQSVEDLASKTKGTHVKEIVKFEKFFKVKWNSRKFRRVHGCLTSQILAFSGNLCLTRSLLNPSISS